jgi:hypothetical protein
MRWLEPAQDAFETTLREALDAAAARTGDEIARRRIWTRIAIPGRPLRGRSWLTRLALAGTLAAATAGAVLVWPRSTGPEHPFVNLPVAPPAPAPPVRPELREPSALGRRIVMEPTIVRTKARQKARLLLAGNAEADLEPNSVLSVDRTLHASVDRGRVSLAVPKQPPGKRFTIGAGPYTISVLGTKFHVRVAGKSVGVDVDEGVVEVWQGNRRVRVEPGEPWTSPAERRAGARAQDHLAARDFSTRPLLRPSRPPVMPSTGPFRDVQAALAEGHPQRALEILEVATRGDGPEAENAAYEVGWILRDRLVRPRQALSAWNRYRARFPHGLLRAETDLSVIETLLMLGETTPALKEAQDFLQRHRGNERQGEIAQLVSVLQGGPAAPTAAAQHEAGDPGPR